MGDSQNDSDGIVQNQMECTENFLLNKSASEADLTNITPTPAFVSSKNKRKRTEREPSQVTTDKKDAFIDLVEASYKRQEELFSAFSKQEEQINKLFPILSEMKTDYNSIKDSVSFLSQQNDDLNKKIESMNKDAKKRDDYIAILEDKIENLERESKKSNFELRNFPIEPKMTNEDLAETVIKYTEKLGVKTDKKDIKDIYLIERKKTMIVRFNSVLVRNAVMKKTKSTFKNENRLSAKHFGFKKNPDAPIFMSDHLTSKAAKLFFHARDIKRTKNYKHCWTSMGRIYLRKNDDAPIIEVKNDAVIQQLMKKD